MMDNSIPNKSHVPCQSWASQNGWSTTSSQGPLINPLSSSQHLGLGSSSNQRPSCDHLQASSHSCMSDLSSLSSRNNLHHSALYKGPHISSISSTLFPNAAIPSAAHIISFAQQTPRTSSILVTANQEKNMPPPSIPQPNLGLQPCRPQHVPLLSPHDPYKAPFQTPLSSQGVPNGLQDLSISLPSCGQHEQPQWIPSSHCRGAVNESFPDAAVHPNKEALQEGIIPAVASNERRRSELLLQRSQLLQQLAEMDKLLETLPPDDSSVGQSPHAAVQSSPSLNDSSQCEQTKTRDANQDQSSASKSHLSEDCSSPLLYEQGDTCDIPEDPMSDAESVKRENTSAESGDDSDPDYSPDSDGDFSGLKSETNSCCSEIHNSSSTPMDETPPLMTKTRAKSGKPLWKETIIPSVKKSCATNRKKLSETVVLPSTKSKTRVYDKRNYCVFCSKPVVKMARHLESVHSDKAEVAAAFQYPKHSKKRQKIWNKLRNQGNFAHNKDVLRTGKGQLAVRKRPKKAGQAQDFLHCLYCQGLFGKKALHRHMSKCPEREKSENESQIGRKRIMSRCVLETVGDLGISDGFKSILSEMVYDDVTQVVMDDTVILQFGEQMLNHYDNDVEKHNYIRQNIRQIARLVLEAQKITPMQKLEDFFYPSNFRHVVSAVNVLSGYDAEKKTYSIPSLALKLGYHLQKTCSIVEGNAVKCGDAELAESARNFLSLYQKKWNKLISSSALTALKETKLNTEKKVPFAEDVKRLHVHLENVHLLAEKKLRDSLSAENYAALAKVILARTIMFNRRRPKEVSLIQLTAFMSRKKSGVLDDMDISVSDWERTLCGFFVRVDIRGNCGRMVPVLLKPSFVSAMELFVSVREACGIPSQNLFLFGRPSALTAYNGSECLQRYVKECGAKNPEALTSRKIRKHCAKMLQLMNLDDDEADQILGPNSQVRMLRQNSNVMLDDVEMESGAKLQPARGQPAASWDHDELSSAGYGPADCYHQQAHGETASSNMTIPPRSVKSGRQGSHYKAKHKWEEAEVSAVERHLMRFIEGHKVPQKNDCVQCLEAEPKALRTRSWKGVKDYVRNRITTLKRQSGCSQDPSKNSSRPRQVEPQQVTGHFQQL